MHMYDYYTFYSTTLKSTVYYICGELVVVPSDFNTSNVLVLPSYKQCTIYLVNKSTLLKKEKSSKEEDLLSRSQVRSSIFE